MDRITFEKWKDRVNQVLIRRYGLEADDLPDWDYYNSYGCGDSPSEAARQVIEYSMECY